MTNYKITEDKIEKFAIQLLEKLGYQYIYGPDIAPNGIKPERESFEEILLLERLNKAVGRINPKIPANAAKDAIKQLLRLNTSELISNNEAFHCMLTQGVKVTYQKDGVSRGDLVWLIDFKNPDKNDFLVSNQFTVFENGDRKRPDIILFINGIPLIVIELKNAADEKATLETAFNQIQTYKQAIPSLFTYNSFTIISDGLEARAGTISSEYGRFMTWKTVDGKKEASHLIPGLETLINGMINKKRLLDLIRHFILFEKSKRADLKTNLTVMETVKKLAGYHQYFAVNKAVKNSIVAAGDKGSRKGGVVWHTQGSGKSLSMVFYAGKIVLALDNPTILVITDRNDLDDQLFDTFAASKQLLRQDPVQAENREHLKNLLKVASGGVVFSTIQKFQPDNGNIYERLSDRKNIIVIADEAHRTQYGFAAKTIDEKNEQGDIIGKKTVYGFAKYIRDALPCATFLGFTGTPIEKEDINTPAVFGDYVDIYDIKQAVEDGATVPIYYEPRLVKINLTEEGEKLIAELDYELEHPEQSFDLQNKGKVKWTRLEALVGSAGRIKRVAADIIAHFEQREEFFEGKGMIVSMSRRIAVQFYNEIIKLRPKWHSDDLKKGAIKVVMTASAADGPDMSKLHTTKDDRRMLSDRIKTPEDELKLVIVCDMWLTGFDAPCLHTLYIDKPMRGHNLMQAIARVNRVYKDKPGGLIVDYLGIASDLKKALSFYSDSGGKGEPALAHEKAVDLMMEKIEVISRMFLEKPVKAYSQDYKNIIKDKGALYEKYFTADTNTKLKIILSAEEHILTINNGKKRFVDEVTALSRAFAIAIPNKKAIEAKDKVGFFQAVKARIVKFDTNSYDTTDKRIDTIIKRVIDTELITDKIIDIFDAAGIKKPDISILSEEFLLEVKNMEHKNVALEVLRKLLNDEIQSRMKTNLAQAESLMEKLKNSIRKYHNKMLTAAEVIEELIEIGRDIRKTDKGPQEMKLTEFEYAFYTAIAANKSAIDVMGKDKLRELAAVLFEKVKQNTSIDWTIKESVRAKIKVIVKRTLRKYGYPPDMEKLATKTVLKQAEYICDELTN